MPRYPQIKCYLVTETSSHQGTGGGFNYIKLTHLVVENHTPVPLRTVLARYKLMKGNECLQEDSLQVDRVDTGVLVKSQTFIRDSPLFDRIQWDEQILVEASQEIPREWISFRTTAPRSVRGGCLLLSSLIIILAIILSYVFLSR
jgi:hypothetical protein